VALLPPAGGRLARRNPVAKLVAATIPAVALLGSLDPVTPALLLALTLLAVAFTGVPAGLLLRRVRPLLLAALTVGAVNAVLTTRQGGRLLLSFGPVVLSTDGALTGLGITLRVLGVALPGILVLASTDPVELVDSLVQQLHAPARFAYGTLAALRLLPLFGQEWHTMARARRARGIEAGPSPVTAVRLFAAQLQGLLVVAIRRGTRLANAMDARGFDTSLPRTSARPQAVTRADLALVTAALAGSAVAVAGSLALGTWRPL